MEATRPRKVISTGNNELDKKMGGGIPAKSLSLVEGQADAGKSVLTQQLVWGSLRSGLSAMVFTTENTVKSLVSQMQSLNLDILDYLLLSKLRVYPLDAKKTRRSLSSGLMPLLSMCANKGIDLAVVDSITYYVTHASIEEVLTFFEDCKVLCGQGMSIICVAHSYAFDENVMVRLGAMCDAHLRMRIETMGSKMIKIMEVAKVRGAEMNTGNIVSFDVEPGLGIRVIPYSKARA
ncbi:MAG: flagellar accessory protein FlaH [Dehalococcoidia bacterium]|nr:flagellar accessory protein FlaH [Dehalococcoidia bacterium]